MNTYSLSIPGYGELRCGIAVAIDGAAPAALEAIDISNGGKTISAAAPCGTVEVAIAETTAPDGTPAVAVAVSVDVAAPCRSIALYPVFGATVPGATHLLSHGRTMGRCKSCRLPAQGLAAEPGEDGTVAFESHFQTVITLGAHGHLHITQPLLQEDISLVSGEISGTSIANLGVATRFECPRPGRHRAAPTTFAFVKDGFKAMCAYGDSQKTDELPDAPQPAGWNSWDYYRWTITEDEVLKNAEFIASDPVLSKHVRRIIVDDGWQYCYGEWEANPLFPSGMAALARNLRKMGFTPGLWMAPFVVEPHSRIAQWDTDMLATGESGDPCLAFECMRRYGFLLDTTVEKSREFLRKTYDRYASMGYGYFKADFLAALLRAPHFRNDSLPRSRLMREAIEPIVEGIAGRAELLGCNYPFDAGNSLAKIVRVGSDIHATWQCAKINAVSVAARAWASNRLWVTDPDFCVVRGPETSDDPDRGRLRCLYVFVTPDSPPARQDDLWPKSFGFDDIRACEARCLLSVALMNGGAVNLSDKLYVLNALGLDLVRRTVSAAHGSAPVPLDLFESDIASKWFQTIPGGFRVLLVNWDDAGRELSLDLGALGISATCGRDFWTDEPVSATGGMLRAGLPPHSCLLAEFSA